jgi:hypothetical protein
MQCSRLSARRRRKRGAMPNPQRTTTFKNVVFDIELKKYPKARRAFLKQLTGQKKQIIFLLTKARCYYA